MWTYHNPVHISVGRNSLDQLPALLAGRSCLLVTFPEAQSLGLVQRMRQLLGAQLRGVIDSIAPNPDVQWLAPLYEQVQRDHAEVPVIVALGGGSAIDSAKALICHTPGGSFADLLALLKQGGQLGAGGHKALIAIPTTAGTGSEVTPWATIWDQAAGQKYSLHQSCTWPEAAVIDAELMTSLPAGATLASGLDALSHALESIWNVNRNPVSMALAVQSACRTLATLPALMQDLDNPQLRSEMAEAALMAGLAFSNTKTALAHSLSTTSRCSMACRTAWPARSACPWCWRWRWAQMRWPMPPCSPSSRPARLLWLSSVCAAFCKGWALPLIRPTTVCRPRPGAPWCRKPPAVRAVATSYAL